MIDNLKIRGQGGFNKPSTLWVTPCKDKIAIDIMEEDTEKAYNAGIYLDLETARALRDKLTEIVDHESKPRD